MKSINELQRTPNLLIRTIGEDGGYGEIQWGRLKASVIWSYGGGWDHVSVAPYKHSYTPSWEDMCKVKDMFFGAGETVVQYHPAEKDYVNNMRNCLHLWRPQKERLPKLPTVMVGIRDGQTNAELRKEIAEIYREDQQ